MGQYTGLRFKAKVHDRGKEALKQMEEFRLGPHSRKAGLTGDRHMHCWDTVRFMLDLPDYWLNDPRCTFIPYGAVCVGGDTWGEGESYVDEEGVWHVECSMKNYTDTIRKFLDTVLPKMISEPCVAETLYEEDDEPRFFDIEPHFNK